MCALSNSATVPFSNRRFEAAACITLARSDERSTTDSLLIGFSSRSGGCASRTSFGTTVSRISVLVSG